MSIIHTTEDSIERWAEKQTDLLDARLERNEITTNEYKELYALLSSEIRDKYDAIRQPEPVTLQRGQTIRISDQSGSGQVVDVQVDQYGTFRVSVIQTTTRKNGREKTLFRDTVDGMEFLR